tara:strand:+ start:1391 stop:1654 length:264 start_codon:yes stop_codon:yes gene_type:complete
MNEKKPNNELSWPLNSEVVGREIVNEKMPNKCMYIVENKDITWEYDEDSLREKILQILDKIGKERDQINFDSEAARQDIASVIVDEL